MATTGKAKGRKAEINLNAHPLAGVLRAACVEARECDSITDPEDAIEEIGAEIDNFIDEEDEEGEGGLDPIEVFTSVIASALAGIATVKGRKGAPDGR